MSRLQERSGGPSFYDIHTAMMYLEGKYPVATSLSLQPLAGRAGEFQLELRVQFVGREETARLAIALGKPSHVVWSATFREGQKPELPSLVFRGLFEVELEVIGALEQLGLPVEFPG